MVAIIRGPRLLRQSEGGLRPPAGPGVPLLARYLLVRHATSCSGGCARLRRRRPAPLVSHSLIGNLFTGRCSTHTHTRARTPPAAHGAAAAPCRDRGQKKKKIYTAPRKSWGEHGVLHSARRALQGDKRRVMRGMAPRRAKVPITPSRRRKRLAPRLASYRHRGARLLWGNAKTSPKIAWQCLLSEPAARARLHGAQVASGVPAAHGPAAPTRLFIYVSGPRRAPPRCSTDAPRRAAQPEESPKCRFLQDRVHARGRKGE